MIGTWAVLLMLLISDSNVIIDMESADLTEAIFRLAHDYAVPDILYQEELHPACEPLLGMGLQIRVVPGEVVAGVEPLRAAHRRLSSNDLLALALARHLGCPLLTGDRHLREVAVAQHLEVYGTLWLMGELYNAEILDLLQVEEAYMHMRAAQRRLPWDDVEEQLRTLRAREVAEA